MYLFQISVKISFCFFLDAACVSAPLALTVALSAPPLRRSAMVQAVNQWIKMGRDPAQLIEVRFGVFWRSHIVVLRWPAR